MVKSGSERSEKYKAKFDAEVVRSRYAATAESAKAKQQTKQQQLADLAGNVRNILNEEGILPLETVKYMAFANKLYGICNKFAGQTAVSVATIEAKKFADYGLSETAIYAIWQLFGDVLGSPPSPL